MAHYKEMNEYQGYTTPAELHKAINTLKGILAGIRADSVINQDESNELIFWCAAHKNLERKHPFDELIPMVEHTLEDSIITQEESSDIIWLCDNFLNSSKEYYDLITTSLQYLLGIIHGLLADNVLNDVEILALQEWINSNHFLSGCYPFDEIESLLSSVLCDGKITDDERNMLKAFLGNFIDTNISYNINDIELNALREKYNIVGICSLCQEIEFQNNVLCFTGKSNRGKRDDIARIITAYGGIFNNNINRSTRYLIVGVEGNPCWAYSCYGRKIEEAMGLRKQGQKLSIISEVDFWHIIENMT